MNVPTMMPTLGRGKHRSARRGACFMEMASYLAGERWSDRPRCTHPLLSSLARLVNDNTPDDERQELAPLIPSVIGLNSDDPRWDGEIARCALRGALPVAAEGRQRAVAVGLLTCERLFDQLDARPAGTLSEATAEALGSVPLAWAWACDFSSGSGPVSLVAFRKRAAPAMVIMAVAGIAGSRRPEGPTILREVLTAAIVACSSLQPPLGPDAASTVHAWPASPSQQLLPTSPGATR